ncbi:response regulator [Polaromonas jejuensis]|uniref:Response regulator n=1 Tax=Polaromonas jejuensis TaxID=457502 RepID=A0ABW0QHB0_9BURK|nr:response regulator [Polaromonas jejuensis]
MNTDPHQAEGLVLQGLEPIVTGALHRFRALLPGDVQLAVELFCEDPRVRADADQLGHALLSVFIIAWQSMVGVAKHVVVSFSEVLLDDSGLNPDAGKLQGGLPPKRYGWLSVSNSSREEPGAFHELLPAPTLMDDKPASARRLHLVEVRDIIAKHQGMISVLAEPGRGTAFEIYLPTVLSMETPAVSLAGADIKHIVYVDDYEAMRELISETLPDAGFRVTCYESGKAALAAIQADPSGCDALITDYRLQGYSGIELLIQIKRICPDLPVIIISGYVDEALRAKAHEHGALLVISKSRDVSELYIALRKLLSRKPNRGR